METIWNGLLSLTEYLLADRGPAEIICVQTYPHPHIYLNRLPDAPSGQGFMIGWDRASLPKQVAWPQFVVDGPYSASCVHTGSMPPESVKLIAEYLPYCVLPIEAHRQKRAISVAHFAQTLDGKIATHTGDSQWIGNPGNLTHAHRMRAICDGILIGKQTLQSDKPSLTVRHVPGKNPRRVVISSTVEDYSSLFAACEEPVLVMSAKAHTPTINLEYVQLPAEDGYICCHDILKALYAKGICLVYIEGGAHTTSNFLKAGAVDILQLHISPQIFGSGVSAIQLPQIDRVAESISFEHFQFVPVEDTLMFVGKPT
ncbi:RibD family protein [Pontibacter sp. G13]|uniref:RibD family protein n=1 Tax=Pontibacter sp. G13 TaxID=3074898 RepID=UPI002889767D|nr:RibD family protein [Pontibacter sp. G13]WNJ16801.1 RibD family protein [Pontibacter sp. G13]